MMRNKIGKQLAIFLTFISIIGVVSGQLRSDIPIPVNSELGSVAGASLLDPHRFSMRQGFSMSFTSGGQFGSSSVSVYTNQMRYLITDNVVLDGTFHIAQPNFSEVPGANNMQIFYQTALKWRPSEHFFISFSLSNMPRYSRFGANQYYSPGRLINSPSVFSNELD